MANKKGTLAYAYWNFRAALRQVGITCTITLDQWRNWWISTGKLDQRGKEVNDYVMARRDTSLPYTLDNIELMTVHESTSRKKRRVK